MQVGIKAKQTMSRTPHNQWITRDVSLVLHNVLMGHVTNAGNTVLKWVAETWHHYSSPDNGHQDVMPTDNEYQGCWRKMSGIEQLSKFILLHFCDTWSRSITMYVTIDTITVTDATLSFHSSPGVLLRHHPTTVKVTCITSTTSFLPTSSPCCLTPVSPWLAQKLFVNWYGSTKIFRSHLEMCSSSKYPLSILTKTCVR